MAPRVSVLFIKLMLLKECEGFVVRQSSLASSLTRRLPTEVPSKSCQESTQRAPLELRWLSKRFTMLAAGASYEVQYGDTAGAALAVRNTMLSRGSADILMDVNWRVMPDEHWAIVGPNGAGKSTLLSALVGRVPVRSGEVLVKPGLRVGYLEQTAVAGANTTLREEVASRMDELQRAMASLDEAEAALVASGQSVSTDSGSSSSSSSSSDESEKGESEGGEGSNTAAGAAALDAYVQAQVAFEAAGGPTAEKRIAGVLKGLGFTEEEARKPCSAFSGGWQMRIALARLLLSEPDLLLLDEPTNHLDKRARNWVANFIANYPKTAIVVSHDEELLRSACSSIAEVRSGSLETFKGMPYDKYLKERNERAKRRISLYSAQVEEAEKLQAFIDRFGATATKAAQAKDRVRKLERLRAEMPPEPPPGWQPKGSKHADNEKGSGNGVGAVGTGGSNSGGSGGAATAGFSSAPGRPAGYGIKPSLKLPKPPPVGVYPLKLKDAAIGWPTTTKTKKQDAQQSSASSEAGGGDESSEAGSSEPVPLLTKVSLAIEKDMRLIVRGPNGSGKSTLVKALAGKVPLMAGLRAEDPDGRLKVGYFTQDLAQDLDPNLVAIDLVMAAARVYDPLLSDEEGRRVLGTLGIRGDMALRKIGNLSGGEKARVALAVFCLVPANVLILDEPSNHLDVDAIQALQQALIRYDGALIVVSHDRPFAMNLHATHVAYVNEGSVTLEQRGLRESDWRDDAASSFEDEVDSDGEGRKGSVSTSATSSSGGSSSCDGSSSSSELDPKALAELRQAAFKKRSALPKLEAKIEKTEAELAALDEEMQLKGADRGALADLLEKRAPLAEKLEAWYGEWATTEELIAQFPDL